MNALDWGVVAVALLYALSGFRQGLVAGALATLGLLAGGAGGVLVTPWLLDRFEPSLTVSLAALGVVLVAASLGRTIGAYVGAALRERISWPPVAALDALGGAVLSAAAVLVLAWALAVAVSGMRLPVVAAQVRSSAVLSTVDRVLAGRSQQLLQAFGDVVDTSIFPRYLKPFVRERIPVVKAPPGSVLADPDVVAAGRSVVKILGTSEVCGHSVEGSGFVYAPGRVLTNAHVVAGIGRPVVAVDGRQLEATPVLYDPDLDLAVLAVDGLSAAPLRFDRSARAGAAASVLGYPENGPFVAIPARVRGKQTFRGPDIYGDGVVARDVLSLYSSVRPGNSGGPLVSRRGRVLGVVFAASVTNSRTGYALSATQVVADAAAARSRLRPVDTGACG